ncbi:MAG TPA: DNA polymerase III subunit delta' [Bryobacteraceae bacterium]|nr:DNA polymerase III subunit delta' [Bryobacteraceae bacterium]
MFSEFFGNASASEILAGMIARKKIPQTILLDGPEGVGKATLARRFAARLLGHPELIERDDLSLEHNAATLAEREKWTAEKRSDDPFFLATHNDFVTFAPDGPLRQIQIPQIRLLKERAQFGPLQGEHRIFLVDGIDRANEQAANSLLKVLEEPPPYLIFLLTAENTYDLLPTIRSRSLPIRLSKLADEEMLAFVRARGLGDSERRVALSAGSPGMAVALDLPTYDKRREAMLALLRSSCGQASFGDWARYSEKLAASRSEKLEPYLKVLFLLLEDVLHLREGSTSLRNIDLRADLAALARTMEFVWIRESVRRLDELIQLLRRNIQKTIALDALVIELRGLAGVK